MDEMRSFIGPWSGLTGREGEKKEQGDDRRVGMELYKTHFSSATMEKIKAHERYEHICYSVPLV